MKQPADTWKLVRSFQPSSLFQFFIQLMLCSIEADHSSQEHEKQQ